MNIHLQTQGFDLTTAIDKHVRDQLHFHLANFQDHIVSVDVFLRDINGPKGGPDKKVLIHTRLTNKGHVTIERTRSDLYAGVTDGVRQSKRAVRRSLSKQRQMEKYALREMNRLVPIQ